MITNHTELLQALIDKYNLKSYLEIGVQNPANNFDKIECGLKTGVDPNCKEVFQMTSDDYFNVLFNRRGNVSMQQTFDLIFIDGDHTAEQVKRDFENSLKCLSDNGFIVIHDVLPENEEGTLVPRQTKKWWGTVYQFAMAIGLYENIEYKTYDIDEGCMVIKKSEGSKEFINPAIIMNWETYKSRGKILMNVANEVII